MMRWILEKSQGRELAIMDVPTSGAWCLVTVVSEGLALGGLYPHSATGSWDLEKSRHKSRKSSGSVSWPWALSPPQQSSAFPCSRGGLALPCGELLALAGGRACFVGACLGRCQEYLWRGVKQPRGVCLSWAKRVPEGARSLSFIS